MLLVAERELRSAARQPKTYRSRLGIASISVLVFASMVWSMRSGQTITGAYMFAVFSWIAFFFSLLAGIATTGDSLSSEKRESTLGLLFLTRLRGYDVVVGKLLSSSLTCFFGLIAIFPVLAIPLMIGGVQLSELGRVVLSLLNVLILSVSIGLFISSLCRHPLRATSLGLLTMMVLSFGLMGLGELARQHYKSPELANGIQLFSPFKCHLQAFSRTFWAPSNNFWLSMGVLFLTSLTFLGLTCWIVPRCWQDKPGGIRAFTWRERLHRLQFGSEQTRRMFRRRVFTLNPFCWLASRERVASFGFLLLLVGFVALTSWTAWRVGHAFGGSGKPLEGFTFIWMWAIFILHGLLLFRIAVTASHRFAEDRQSGALELLLATSFKARRIVRGQWLALARQMAGPILVVLLAQAFFLWILVQLMIVETRGSWGIHTHADVWALLWNPALSPEPEAALALRFATTVILAITFLLMATWITLGSVGMWMGIRSRYPRMAPWFTLGLVLVPPWPIFGLILMVLEDTLTFWSEFEFLYLCMILGLGLGLVHTGTLTLWSWIKLRRHFRVAVTDRSHFLQIRRSWPERAKLVGRFAVGAGVIALLITGWHRVEYWRGERAWKEFETKMAAAGERINLDSVAPPHIPAEQNFAAAPVWAPAFGRFAGGTSGTSGNSANLHSVNIQGQPMGWWNPNDSKRGNWREQTSANLPAWTAHFRVRPQFPALAQTNSAARSILFALTLFTNELDGFQQAALRPSCYFPINYEQTQYRNSFMSHLIILRNVGEIFQLRAAALLELGESNEAFANIELIFRFAEALKQEPFIESQRARHDLANLAIQAIWEGLGRRCWSEIQIASLQSHLEKLDILAAYGRTAHAEMVRQFRGWERFKSRMSGDFSQAPPRERKLRFLGYFYPAGWVYHHQIELYEFHHNYVAPVIDEHSQRFFSPKHQTLLSQLPRTKGFLDRRQLEQAIREFPAGSARTQTSVNLALLACALERHRLANGEYPEALESLSPTFIDIIPHDIINGLRLNYHRTADGQFLLYSVGINQRNDGGVGLNELDWVWKYKASQ